MARDDWKQTKDPKVSRKDLKDGSYLLTATSNTSGSNKASKKNSHDNHVHVHKDGADFRVRMKDGTIVKGHLGGKNK
jgi:hypothetical protein